LEQYNGQRSHEALGRKTPQSVYRASPRSYPGKIPSIEYGPGTTVRAVRYNGEIKWHGDLIYVSQVLAQEPLGLRQIEDEKWEVRYSFHLLGTLDQRTKKILPAKIWHKTNSKKV
jgi:hypothetical protein